MKAMLVTRCGCSRMVDVPDGANRYHVPLPAHYRLGHFHDDLTDHMSTWDKEHERRTFVRQRDPFVMPYGPAVAMFAEEPRDA